MHTRITSANSLASTEQQSSGVSELILQQVEVGSAVVATLVHPVSNSSSESLSIDTGHSAPVEVSEPATLLILGLGLLFVGLARNRKSWQQFFTDAIRRRKRNNQRKTRQAH